MVQKKEIKSAYCSCTAGLLGFCNHVVSMFFRIETAVSMGVTKSSGTSQLCQWNIPKNTRNILEIKPISELTFIQHHFRERKNTGSITAKK